MALQEENCTQTVLSQKNFEHRILHIIEIKVTQFLLQVGGLTCRWQRHSVKPSCCECSMTVEQAKTQLRVVVPIEEEVTQLLNGHNTLS
jgi:hypothetical protein